MAVEEEAVKKYNITTLYQQEIPGKFVDDPWQLYKKRKLRQKIRKELQRQYLENHWEKSHKDFPKIILEELL